jgi:hypothetical protein
VVCDPGYTVLATPGPVWLRLTARRSRNGNGEAFGAVMTDGSGLEQRVRRRAADLAPGQPEIRDDGDTFR